MTSTPSSAVQPGFELLDPMVARAAALQSVKANGCLCDLHAAALWGLPLPVAAKESIAFGRIRLARRAGQSADRRDGVQGRRIRLPAEHRTLLGGVEVTSPARTWLDCAALVSAEFTVAIGDAVLREGLTTQGELRAMVQWGSKRRGIRAAKLWLPRLDPRAESPRESWVRASLLRSDVPAPEVNVDVTADGQWLARVDLAWPRFRIALEYDGREHHGPQQRDHDSRRRARLADAGWIVIVIRNEDLSDPYRIALRVMAALRSRGWRTTSVDRLHTR